jgi:hypothetical protein
LRKRAGTRAAAPFENSGKPSADAADAAADAEAAETGNDSELSEVTSVSMNDNSLFIIRTPFI